MAQQVKIAGALFQDVPSISVPDANDVWHAFTDTSDADAVAADLALGRTAYAGGVKLVGTNPGGATVEPLSVTENGVYTAAAGHAYSPVTVNVSGGGGGGGSTSDPIRFFDYDGTLVASYTEVPAELPDVPTHDGLVDGTWNYTLAEVGEQFAAMGTCDVGANFATESGATEIDVEFVDAARLSPYLRFAPKGTVTVDWGDGSPTDTVTGTSLTTRKDVQHVYAAPGKYTIRLFPASGTTYAMHGTNAYTLLHANKSNVLNNYVYSSCIKAVRIGTGTSIGNYAFFSCRSIAYVILHGNISSIGQNAFDGCVNLISLAIPNGVTNSPTNMCSYCYSIESVSLPISVTRLNNYSFQECSRLQSISLPRNIATIGSSIFEKSKISTVTIPQTGKTVGERAFYQCYSLQSLVLQDGVNRINSYAFANDYNLAAITMPASVNYINERAFQTCGGLAEVHLEPTTPPTLMNVNAFGTIPSDCKFYVPYSEDHSILDAYKTATNWSNYASCMVEEPQS